MSAASSCSCVADVAVAVDDRRPELDPSGGPGRPLPFGGVGITFEHLAGGGYLACVDGLLDASTIGEFRRLVYEERPIGGFQYAVIDISGAEIPNLWDWPVDHRTLELLQPLGRLITQPINPGCRSAIVTTDPVLDVVLEDLVPLAGPSATQGANLDVARFESVESALDWCRSEPDDARRLPSSP